MAIGYQARNNLPDTVNKFHMTIAIHVEHDTSVI